MIQSLVVLSLAAAMPRVSGTDASSLSPTETNAPPIRLAVGGFAALDDSAHLQRQNGLLIDLLTVRLSQTGRFDLVERQAIDSITREISLSLSQVSKPADAIHAGKLLRADWLLLGSQLNRDGTNTVIVRIVEARTGIIRDLAAVPASDTNLVDAAAQIAEFVVNSADRVSRAEQRVFLGIGGFEDLGINNRYPDFRKNLRVSLEQAYRGTRYAVVERTMVNSLLGELRLNLSGLTGDAPAETPAQPAFLLVDGTYQSFHDETAKINLILRVQEIGGGQRVYALKEPPGKELDEKIADILGGALRDLRQSSSPQPRKAEAQTQLARGKERARIRNASDLHRELGGYPQWGERGLEHEKRLRNILEAIGAFEAALLLDPDDAEAKVYLAMCLLDPAIGKKDAGRDYLGEVIAGSTNVAMLTAARRQLACSYLSFDERVPVEDDRHALDLFLALDRDAAQPADRAWALRHALSPVYRLRRSGHLSTEEGLRLHERLYLAECEAAESAKSNTESLFWPHMAQKRFQDFEHFFENSRELTEAHLEKFLPQVVEKHPGLAPYIWAAYGIWDSYGQPAVRTNLMGPLRLSLEFCRDRPEKVTQAGSFYLGYVPRLLEWCVCHGEFRSGEILGEIRQQDIARHASDNDYIQGLWSQGVEDSAKTFYYLGYCKRALGKWKEASEAFAEAQKQSDPVILQGDGPWGAKGTRIHARELLEECRRHLAASGQPGSGEPAPDALSTDPVAFALGEPVLTLGRSTVFACDGDQIWLTDGYAPFVYNQRDQTLTDLDWPTNIEQQVTCIRVEKNTVWWGTRGSGLVEMDKQTKRCRVYQEVDGLLLPHISALAATKERLWIGYGRKDLGGVGYLDLRTRRFTCLTPELNLGSVTNRLYMTLSKESEAPRHCILSLCPTPTGDLWLFSGDLFGLRRFSPAQNRWETFYERLLLQRNCMAAGSNHVAVGGVSSASGVMIYTIANKRVAEVQLPDSLKRSTACTGPCPFLVYSMAVNGEKVWVGGEGFLALVDLKTARVEKLCDFDPRRLNAAQGLEIEGDNLWVAIKNKLYRLPKTGPG